MWNVATRRSTTALQRPYFKILLQGGILMTVSYKDAQKCRKLSEFEEEDECTCYEIPCVEHDCQCKCHD